MTASFWGPPAGGGGWSAADSGLIAQTYDPATASAANASLIGSGILYLQGLHVPKQSVSTGPLIQQVAAGTSMTPGQNFFGLFSQAGTLLAVTADLAASFGAANALIAPSWVAPVTIPAGFYWLGLLFNSTGTLPTFRVSMSAVSTSYAAAVNANLTAGTARFATNGSSLTAMPASITPASNQISSTILAFWAALR